MLINAGSLLSFQPPPDTLTYETFFGLKEKPFSLNADPRFLYSSPSHAATFENLVGGIRRREGLLVLTGEIGTGKTTLCRAVLRNLGRKTFSSFVPDPFASREDLLKTLLVDFGVTSIQDLTTGSLKHASRIELSYLLSGFLESLDALNAFVVVIIDEAQNMSLPLIEEVRILSDSVGGKGLLQIVFVGQLELLAKLKSPEMRQVDQRVCGYNRLSPLTREATAGYIEHRLHVAGGGRERVLFSPEVIDILHRRSGGVPRLINRVCDRALHLAHRRQAACVDREILETALVDLGAATLTPTWASIAFPEPEALEPQAAPPAQATRPSAPRVPAGTFEATIAAWVDTPLPIEQEEAFSKRVDEWLAQELAPTSRKFTSPEMFAPETSDTPAQAPAAARSTGRRAVPGPHEGRRERRAETYMHRLGRMWLKAAAIALVSVVVITAAAVGAARLPGTLTDEVMEPPAISTAETVADSRIEPATPPIDAPQPMVAPPPVEAPQPMASGDYVVGVGLFASRERADRLVEALTQAGLPAAQRPFQLRNRPVQQVVLGPFAQRADAVAGLQRLRQLGGHADATIVDTAVAPSEP